ncbi:MAG: hypothetical protein ABI599_15310 [Flavobacteriales bacterium]
MHLTYRFFIKKYQKHDVSEAIADAIITYILGVSEKHGDAYAEWTVGVAASDEGGGKDSFKSWSCKTHAAAIDTKDYFVLTKYMAEGDIDTSEEAVHVFVHR